MNHRTRAALACALGYCALTAVLGMNVLAHPSSTVIHDVGDPLLTAALLHWNAWTLPFSHAWWQFPIFAPTPDVLAFSEHLLGLSVVASPIEWLTRDPLLSANLATLLTYPLCAVTMFLLARELGASITGAFLAGLAFGFSPYRVSQLSHVQMLAAFWAPLALLGLHAYLRDGRRRWLALYAASWLLQSLANGYSLVFFSILVGCWGLWFVIRPRRWTALRDITIATLLAVIPMVPVLLTYVRVHAANGFTRSLADVESFSAEIGSVLCASRELTFWSWLRVSCRAEGEVFPGVVLAGIVIAAWWWGLRPDASAPSRRTVSGVIRTSALVTAAVAAAGVVSVLVAGPWQISLAGARLSVSSAPKPVLLATAALLVAFASSRRMVEAARRMSRLGFYLAAAVMMWLFALGPTVIVDGVPRGLPGPFAAVMALPGGASLRAPARFWLMANLCLAVAVGLASSRFLSRLRPSVSTWAAIALGVGLMSDGWAGPIITAPGPASWPDGAVMRGGTVLALPVGNFQDFGPQFLAVTGGWRSVNGYSGYEPRFYEAVRQGARFELDALFDPFLDRGDLFVVVDQNLQRQRDMVERQPGVVLMGGGGGYRQYLLRRHEPPRAVPVPGPALAVAGVSSSCAGATAPVVLDGDPSTRWVCGPQRGREAFEADLGSAADVGGVRFLTGEHPSDFPRSLTIETSLDGAAWEAARSGDVIAATIEGALADPRQGATVLTFPARRARFVRLRQTGADDQANWAIAELEIRGPESGDPAKSY